MSKNTYFWPDLEVFGPKILIFTGAHTDPCLTDLDRILTEERDPGAHHYLVQGTVPIKGKKLGFWVPMH